MLEDSNPMPIRLQLNSERAVRKLIEGDPELQIAIKKAVITNISRDMVAKDVAKSVAEELNKVFLTSANSGWETHYVLKKEYKDILKSHAESEVRAIVMEACKGADEIYKKKLEELQIRFEDKVDKFLSNIAEYMVSESVQRMIDSKVEEKLQKIKEQL